MENASLTVTVLQRGEARFDMCGQKLPFHLHDTVQTISAGLVRRLRGYAMQRLENSGFAVSAWNCEVYTMDAELPPSERYYCVEFTNTKGGMLGVQGILTKSGWPALDHGLCVDVK